MGLFTKKKTEDEGKKKVGEKAAKVSSGREKKEKGAVKGGQDKKNMKDLYNEGKPALTEKAGKKEDTSAKKSAERAKRHGHAYRVLVRPIVTEKASVLGTENKYVFEVSQDANKIETAKAVNEVYGINPISVNIIKMKGKRSRHGRITGKRKDWKKAIVTLPEGKSIKLYEGV